MAGIIARITRSNRERLEKKKNEIGVGKCNYTIEAFDDHFEPTKHNKYIKARFQAADKIEAKQFYEFVKARLNQLDNENRIENSKFKWRSV